MFFDNVHLLKNIRNNLYNSKKFVFPSFSFELGNGKVVSVPDGFITWRDLQSVHEKDSTLSGNLRKARDLTYTALHPANKKQNVKLALSIFSESTIAAVRSYCPERKDMASFLDLIHTWWTIVNSNSRFHPNSLGNAIVSNDGKLTFLDEFARWIQSWAESPSFCLSKQTSDAFVRTLRAQACLIEDLLNEGYSYVCPRKLQSDPLERRFGQYRQMSGGRFLVSLREVMDSEKILQCRSLLKANVTFWDEDLSLRPEPTSKLINEIVSAVEEREGELENIRLSDESAEVAVVVAGYIGLKMSERSNCDDCQCSLTSKDVVYEQGSYFNLLSRGGLTKPSPNLADFVISAFALLDEVDKDIMRYPHLAKASSEKVLSKYCPMSCSLARNILIGGRSGLSVVWSTTSTTTNGELQLIL